MFVGNDVVDLASPRTQGKASHARFVERVFTDREASSIAEHSDPDRRMWTLWAAKEAAYKVVSRLAETPPVFAHHAFAVSLSGETSGSVDFEGLSVPFVVVRDAPLFLHVVAWNGAASDSLPAEIHAGCAAPTPDELPSRDDLPDFLARHFSAREAGQILRVESAIVRLHAKQAIAEHLKISTEQVLILTHGGADGRTPPEVELVGHPARVTLSLSHDGAYVGWSFACALHPPSLDAVEPQPDVASQ